MRDLIGVDHIGLGADYDGVDVLPRGLEDVSTYPYLLARLMEDPRWTVEDIKKIAGEERKKILAQPLFVQRNSTSLYVHCTEVMYFWLLLIYV